MASGLIQSREVSYFVTEMLSRLTRRSSLAILGTLNATGRQHLLCGPVAAPIAAAKAHSGLPPGYLAIGRSASVVGINHDMQSASRIPTGDDRAILRAVTTLARASRRSSQNKSSAQSDEIAIDCDGYNDHSLALIDAITAVGFRCETYRDVVLRLLCPSWLWTTCIGTPSPANS